MALSINWGSKVINVPQNYLSLVSAGLYQLDVNAFRLDLKNIEDSEDGISFPDTHRHNTEVVLAGVTYSRIFEIINGYTITFEDVGIPYTVLCVGANHNIADVKNINNVSLIIGNSAGLITVATGGSTGPTAAQIASAVRTEIATELARMDTNISTRLGSSDTALADVRKVNNTVIEGSGTEEDPWGPAI